MATPHPRLTAPLPDSRRRCFEPGKAFAFMREVDGVRLLQRLANATYDADQIAQEQIGYDHSALQPHAEVSSLDGMPFAQNKRLFGM